jgi:hypothetical protein
MEPYEDNILCSVGQQREAAGSPPAWSTSRDDLYEATIWLKNYDGGIYTVGASTPKPRLKGLYISGYPGRHAYMDLEILITNLHGEKTALNAAVGKNTDIGPRLRAAKATMEAGELVGVVVGRDAPTPRANQ